MIPLFPALALADDPPPLPMNQPITGPLTSTESTFQYTLILVADARVQFNFKTYSPQTSVLIEPYADPYFTLQIGNSSRMTMPQSYIERCYLRKGSYAVTIQGTYNSVLAAANGFEFKAQVLATYDSTDMGVWSDTFPLALGTPVKGMMTANNDEYKEMSLDLAEPTYVQITYKLSGYGAYLRGGYFKMERGNMFFRLKKPRTYTRRMLLGTGTYNFGLDNDGYWDLRNRDGAAFYTLSVTKLTPPTNLLKMPKNTTITVGAGAKISSDATRRLPQIGYDSKRSMNVNPSLTWALAAGAPSLVTITGHTVIQAGLITGKTKLVVTDAHTGGKGTFTLNVKPNTFTRNKALINKKLKEPQVSLKSAVYSPDKSKLVLTWYLYNNTGSPIKAVSRYTANILTDPSGTGGNRIHNGSRLAIDAVSLAQPLAKGKSTTFTTEIGTAALKDGDAQDLTGGLYMHCFDMFVITDKGLVKSGSTMSSTKDLVEVPAN